MAIQIKGSDISGVVPAESELQERELGINTKDGKLFTKTPLGDIIEIGVDNINTGLETPTPASGVHSGHRYINGIDPEKFTVLGADATDLSYANNTTASNSIGASGDGSLSAGINASATGSDSFALGNAAQAIADDTYVIGGASVSSGLGSFTIGNSSQTIADGSITLGSLNSNSGVSSLCLGSGNNLSNLNDILIGTGLLSSGFAGSVVIGKYNQTNGDNFLTIADGTSSGARSNLLSLKTNGVVVLEKVTASLDITAAGNKAVVTVGYLNDQIASDNIVTKVNEKVGNVTLFTDDIAQGNNVSRRWMTDTEKAQIGTNTNNIAAKETLIPAVTADINKFLKVITPGNGGQSLYEWAALDGNSISLALSGLSDVSAYNSSIDGRKIMRLPGTVDGPVSGSAVFEHLNRGTEEFQLRAIGTSSGLLGEVEGGEFELQDDPYYWGINKRTADVLAEVSDLFVNEDIPDTAPSATDLKTVFVASTPNLGYYDDIVQTYIADNAANLFYDNTTSLLATTNVNDAIDLVLAETVTNSTNIGDKTGLTTDAKDDLVDAINEVDSHIDTNTGAIGILTGLTTDADGDLVAAINEVDGHTNDAIGAAGINTTSIGTLLSLETSVKDNLVNAINEVHGEVSNININYRQDTGSGSIAVLDYSFADTTSGGFSLTLPASAGLSLGNQLMILDNTGNFSTANLTVIPDGSDTIMGSAGSIALDVDNREYKFIWSGSDWRVI